MTQANARQKFGSWLDGGLQIMLRLCFLALLFSALGLVLATYAQHQNQWLGHSLTWWRELGYGLHANLLFFAAMLALQQDHHLRIDLLSSRLSPIARGRLDRLFDLVFALPLTLLLLATALPWAWHSWARLEGSASPSGIAALYVFKALLVLAAGLGLGSTLVRIVRPGPRAAT